MGFLEHLWSGWRGEYVASVPGDDDLDTSRPACVFCGILASEEPAESTNVVHHDNQVAVVLNAYPYTTGHMMVMPVRHVAELDDLRGDEAVAVWDAVRHAVSALRRVYSPEGFNVGMNLGRVAGAGIPGHLHVHVLPRWGGDTNFMTAVANTRVLPEALEVTRERLAAAWRQDGAS